MSRGAGNPFIVLILACIITKGFFAPQNDLVTFRSAYEHDVVDSFQLLKQGEAGILSDLNLFLYQDTCCVTCSKVSHRELCFLNDKNVSNCIGYVLKFQFIKIQTAIKFPETSQEGMSTTLSRKADLPSNICYNEILADFEVDVDKGQIRITLHHGRAITKSISHDLHKLGSKIPSKVTAKTVFPVAEAIVMFLHEALRTHEENYYSYTALDVISYVCFAIAGAIGLFMILFIIFVECPVLRSSSTESSQYPQIEINVNEFKENEVLYEEILLTDSLDRRGHGSRRSRHGMARKLPALPEFLEISEAEYSEPKVT